MKLQPSSVDDHRESRRVGRELDVREAKESGFECPHTEGMKVASIVEWIERTKFIGSLNYSLLSSFIKVLFLFSSPSSSQ